MVAKATAKTKSVRDPSLRLAKLVREPGSFRARLARMRELNGLGTRAAQMASRYGVTSLYATLPKPAFKGRKDPVSGATAQPVKAATAINGVKLATAPQREPANAGELRTLGSELVTLQQDLTGIIENKAAADPTSVPDANASPERKSQFNADIRREAIALGIPADTPGLEAAVNSALEGYHKHHHKHHHALHDAAPKPSAYGSAVKKDTPHEGQATANHAPKVAMNHHPAALTSNMG